MTLLPFFFKFFFFLGIWNINKKYRGGKMEFGEFGAGGTGSCHLYLSVQSSNLGQHLVETGWHWRWKVSAPCTKHLSELQAIYLSLLQNQVWRCLGDEFSQVLGTTPVHAVLVLAFLSEIFICSTKSKVAALGWRYRTSWIQILVKIFYCKTFLSELWPIHSRWFIWAK